MAGVTTTGQDGSGVGEGLGVAVEHWTRTAMTSRQRTTSDTLDLGLSGTIALHRQRPGRTPTQVPIEKARHRLEARRGERGREVARESDRRHPLSAERSPR